MTISSETARWAYLGDGATQSFDFDNVIYGTADLAVFVDGVAQVHGSDYTVTGLYPAPGGIVTFATAPAAGAQIDLVSRIAALQPTSYPVLSELSSASLEKALDRLARLAGQLAAGLARTVRLADGDAAATLALPAAAARAGRLLGFDGGGDIAVIEPAAMQAYEEGEFMPALGGDTADGSHTYAARAGRFVRIGSLVWMSLRLALSVKDPAMAGAVRLRGLPYAAAVQGFDQALAVGEAGGLDLGTGYPVVQAGVTDGGTAIALTQAGDGQAALPLDAAQVGPEAVLTIAGCYRTG